MGHCSRAVQSSLSKTNQPAANFRTEAASSLAPLPTSRVTTEYLNYGVIA